MPVEPDQPLPLGQSPDTPDALPNNGYLSLVTIAAYTDPAFAHLARLRLEREAISCCIADEYLPVMNWFYANAIGGVKVRVPLAVAQRAADILAQEPPPADPQPAADDDLDPRLFCPRCGCTDVYLPRLSRRLAMLSVLILGIPIPMPAVNLRCPRCGNSWRNRAGFPIITTDLMSAPPGFPVTVLPAPSSPPSPDTPPPSSDQPAEATPSPDAPPTPQPAAPPSQAILWPWAIYLVSFLTGCFASSSLHESSDAPPYLFHAAGLLSGGILFALLQRTWLRRRSPIDCVLTAILLGLLELPFGWFALFILRTLIGHSTTSRLAPPW